MRNEAPIFVAGGDTLIGAALVRQLRLRGGATVLDSADHAVDFENAASVEDFIAAQHPACIYLAAGKSGGIAANQKYPADLMHNNLAVVMNVLHAAHVHQPRKVLYLASSCSYPRQSPQPMRIEHLMTGPLEPTNAAYATAKLAGIQLCQAYHSQHGDPFIAGIPANSFGIEDDFGPEDSHVIGALIRRMHEAAENGEPSVTVWGTGKARREFLFADDVASACIAVMERYHADSPINISGGTDVSIGELARIIQDVVGYRGELRFDTSKPDGMPFKSLDGSALAALGWKPEFTLREGLARTYAAFKQKEGSADKNPSEQFRGTAHV